MLQIKNLHVEVEGKKILNGIDIHIKKGEKNPELLHNRINLFQFSNGVRKNDLPTPLILSIGNLIKENNMDAQSK